MSDAENDEPNLRSGTVEDVVSRLNWRANKLDGPGYLMPNCVDDLRDASRIITQLQAQVARHLEIYHNQRESMGELIDESDQLRALVDSYKKSAENLDEMYVREYKKNKELQKQITDMKSSDRGWVWVGDNDHSTK